MQDPLALGPDTILERIGSRHQTKENWVQTQDPRELGVAQDPLTLGPDTGLKRIGS